MTFFEASADSTVADVVARDLRIQRRFGILVPVVVKGIAFDLWVVPPHPTRRAGGPTPDEGDLIDAAQEVADRINRGRS
jgi:hypothetical protein